MGNGDGDGAGFGSFDRAEAIIVSLLWAEFLQAEFVRRGFPVGNDITHLPAIGEHLAAARFYRVKILAFRAVIEPLEVWRQRQRRTTSILRRDDITRQLIRPVAQHFES